MISHVIYPLARRFRLVATGGLLSCSLRTIFLVVVFGLLTQPRCESIDGVHDDASDDDMRNRSVFGPLAQRAIGDAQGLSRLLPAKCQTRDGGDGDRRDGLCRHRLLFFRESS